MKKKLENKSERHEPFSAQTKTELKQQVTQLSNLLGEKEEHLGRNLGNTMNVSNSFL